MRVLSLFDGVSCARVALDKLNVPVKAYFSSEIDKYAIQISEKNYPDITRLGDITKVNYSEGNSIKFDLLIGGSPCQDLSIAKKDRQGLEGSRSSLFWEYVRILQETKPKYFVLENVASMPKEAKDAITEALGVEPIMINASLVSGQNRKRLFWTNIQGVTQPRDQRIMLRDILLDGTTDDLKSLCITATYHKKNEQNFLLKREGQMIRIGDIGSNAQAHRVYSPDGKSVALSALGGGQGAKTGLYLVVPEATKKRYAVAIDGDSVDLSFPMSKTRRGRVGNKAKNLMTSQSIGVFKDGALRKLHPIECERLQGLPDNYTEGVSNTQRYKACGNAFNVDVVAHILSLFFDFLFSF